MFSIMVVFMVILMYDENGNYFSHRIYIYIYIYIWKYCWIYHLGITYLPYNQSLLTEYLLELIKW